MEFELQMMELQFITDWAPVGFNGSETLPLEAHRTCLSVFSRRRYISSSTLIGSMFDTIAESIGKYFNFTFWFAVTFLNLG